MAERKRTVEVLPGEQGTDLFAGLPWKLQDADWVTPYTIAAYLALRRYTDFGGVRGAHASLPKLAGKAHMSRAKLHQELNRLREHGWVEWESGGIEPAE